MNVLITFVPLILAVLMVGALAKLAVFLSRSGSLSWKHSFYYAGFLFTLSMAAKVSLHFFPFPEMVPPLLSAAFGLALTTSFAAFFFSHHAVTPERAAIGRTGAVIAAALWTGLLLLLSLPLLLLVPGS